MVIDLQAHRCPTAQILANRALEMFMNSEDKELVLLSIEPSLQRNLEARLAHNDIKADIVSVSSNDITDRDLQRWQDKFDDDDYGGVRHIMTIFVQKRQQQSA